MFYNDLWIRGHNEQTKDAHIKYKTNKRKIKNSKSQSHILSNLRSNTNLNNTKNNNKKENKKKPTCMKTIETNETLRIEIQSAISSTNHD